MSQTRQLDLQKVQALLKKGDPEAIATLLNRHLSAKGIVAKVERRDKILSILLESAPVPDRGQMVEFVRKGMQSIQPESIQMIRVYGREPRQVLPTWNDVIVLAPPPQSNAGELSVLGWLNQGNLDADAQPSATSAATLPSPSSNLNQSVPSTADVSSDDQRFLRFYMSPDDTALLPLSSIQEVVKVPIAEILPVPYMPDCVVGVYHWRGEMLWLVNLGQQLGFPSAKTVFHSPDPVTAIVIQADSKSLGIVVSKLSNVETHDLRQLQPPTPGVFLKKLLPFVQGYLAQSKSPVLNAEALIQDPLLQVHRAA